eukprot:scaffold668290_cov111-Prasinocladus_malaysianus.AAC.1
MPIPGFKKPLEATYQIFIARYAPILCASHTLNSQQAPWVSTSAMNRLNEILLCPASQSGPRLMSCNGPHSLNAMAQF